MVKNKSIITLLLLLIAITGFTQPAQLYFNHLTTENGLSQGVVNNILTDKKGFTWFTSYDGINRFDGTNCISNSQIGPGMEGISVTRCIVEDKNGDIWIGSNEALICYSYLKNRFEKFIVKASALDKSVNKLAYYKPQAVFNNDLLIYGGYNIFFVFDIATHQSTRLKIPDNFVGNLTSTAAEGNVHRLVFIKSNRDSLSIFRLKADEKAGYSWQVNSLKSHGEIFGNPVIEQSSAAVYLASENAGIWKYDFANNSVEKLFQLDPHCIIRELYFDKIQRLWVSTEKDGLFVYNITQKKMIQNYRSDANNAASLMTDQITAMLVTDDNMLWVSSWGKGVNYCQLTENGFSHHFTKEEAVSKKTNNFIRGMAEGVDGNFYCNTQFAGVVQLNKELKYKKTLSAIYSNTIGIDDSQVNLFFGDRKIFKYNLVSNSIKEIEQPTSLTPKYPVYFFSSLKNGNTLAASMYGIWCIDNKKNILIDLPGLNETCREQSIFAFEARNGNIYKYCVANGLQYYKFANGRYNAAFTFPQNPTGKYVYEESDSAAWIATTNGLFLWNPQQLKIIKHYTIDDGLPNNAIYAIAPDKLGRLWLSTNKGISMFTKTTERFKNFSGISGMQGNEYNSHTVVTAADGRIIFGGVNGLTAIRPWEIKTETTTPIIQFTAIKADSSINPFQFDEAGNNTLQLAAGSSALELNFVAIEYNNPAACQLKYKLKGYDDDWVITSNPGYARYVKLKPGRYTFEIMVANADGIWSEEIKKLQIKINAQWWQQVWFKLLIGFLSIVIILLGIRQYVRQKLYRQQVQMEKQQAIVQERERIITDLHDDVGATLSSMHIYGDLAGEVWESKPEQSKEMVGKITTQSKDLMNRMGDIVWSLKPFGEEKNTLTGRLKNYSNELLAAKNIECEFDIDEALSNSITNPIARKNILLIAKEAMNNIAKYSSATHATISVQQQNEELLLEIKDNGKGFDNLAKQAGNGLQNMKQRSELLNGKFVINTSAGNGTHITCIFPIAIISHTG